MRRTPLRRRAPLRARPTPSVEPLSPSPAPFRSDVGSSLAASPAQRAKVAGQACLVCGSRRRVDPAHLVARAHGGCDHPDCVVPLCRRCHRAYDAGMLDLLPRLEPRFRPEVAHAVLHLGLARAMRRLTRADRHSGEPAAMTDTIPLVRKEHTVPITDPTASAQAPPVDPTRRAQARRLESLSASERLEVLDRLCRELTELASTATRVR
jgi:hypothetical protein